MAEFQDPRRTIGNLIRIGTIDSVDRAAATCRVRTGENLTGDIAWLALRAGDTRIWSAPSVGEQCLLLCPEGDAEAGLAVMGLFSNANPAPSGDAKDLLQFKDDGRLSYDAAAHRLEIVLPHGATIAITAPGGGTWTGDLHIAGKLHVDQEVQVDAKITSSGDVVAAGKSLTTHKHNGVTAGGGVSGMPV